MIAATLATAMVPKLKDATGFDKSKSTPDAVLSVPVQEATQTGTLPLGRATRVVQLLLEHSADPKKPRTDGSNGKWTPLRKATQKGNTAIAQPVANLLKQHGAV